MNDFLSILVSLAIALTSVGISHLIYQRNKFKSNFKGVLAELDYNLLTLKLIKMTLEEGEKKATNNEEFRFPLVELETFTFNHFILEGYLMRLDMRDKEFLMGIYKLFEAINRYIEYYEETKLNLLYRSAYGGEFRETVRQDLKTLISEVEPKIEEFIQRHSNYL
jgi:hypothetical protein